MLADRFKELAADSSMNVKEFCAFIDVSYRTVQNYLAEKSSPTGAFLTILNVKTGVSPNWLLLGLAPKYVRTEHQNRGMENLTSGQNEGMEFHTPTDFVQIPRYDIAASAGHGSVIDGETTNGSYAFNRSWIERRGLSAKSLAVVSVSGDSMLPDLYDGDLILVDQDQTAPRDGYMYAVRYSDDLFVKRMQRLPGERALLLSANSGYPPILIDNDGPDSCAVIGRVVASMHQW